MKAQARYYDVGELAPIDEVHDRLSFDAVTRERDKTAALKRMRAIREGTEVTVAPPPQNKTEDSFGVDAYDESKHRRDKNGRWAQKGAAASGQAGETGGTGSGLHDYVRMVAGLSSNAPASAPGKLLEDHGREFPFGADSYEGKRGKAQLCYMNAGRMALDHPNDYTYVEGLVSYHGVPIEHAWVVNKAGRVIDPTFPNGENVRGYYGVPIKTSFLRDFVLETKVWGVFGYMSVSALVKHSPEEIVDKQKLADAFPPPQPKDEDKDEGVQGEEQPPPNSEEQGKPAVEKVTASEHKDVIGEKAIDRLKAYGAVTEKKTGSLYTLEVSGDAGVSMLILKKQDGGGWKLDTLGVADGMRGVVALMYARALFKVDAFIASENEAPGAFKAVHEAFIKKGMATREGDHIRFAFVQQEPDPEPELPKEEEKPPVPDDDADGKTGKKVVKALREAVAEKKEDKEEKKTKAKAKDADWDESKHPRVEAGSTEGGEFTAKEKEGTLAPGSGLTHDEQEAIYEYTSSAFEDVNSHLRGSAAVPGTDKKHLDAFAENIDSAMAKVGLSTKKQKLYRMIGSDDATDAIFGNIKPGDEFVDKAFASTDKGSVLFKKESQVKGIYYVAITAPKGTYGLDVSKGPLAGLSGANRNEGSEDEREVILARESRFRVDSIDKENNLINVTVVGQRTPSKKGG